jgi:hypothetical protein
LDTVAQTPEDNARRILACLTERGFVRADVPSHCSKASSPLSAGEV